LLSLFRAAALRCASVSFAYRRSAAVLL
jgi:hypothetical protein